MVHYVRHTVKMIYFYVCTFDESLLLVVSLRSPSLSTIHTVAGVWTSCRTWPQSPATEYYHSFLSLVGADDDVVDRFFHFFHFFDFFHFLHFLLFRIRICFDLTDGKPGTEHATSQIRHIQDISQGVQKCRGFRPVLINWHECENTENTSEEFRTSHCGDIFLLCVCLEADDGLSEEITYRKNYPTIYLLRFTFARAVHGKKVVDWYLSKNKSTGYE